MQGDEPRPAGPPATGPESSERLAQSVFEAEGDALEMVPSRGERALLALGLCADDEATFEDNAGLAGSPAFDEVWFDAADLASASRVEVGVEQASFVRGLGTPKNCSSPAHSGDVAGPRGAALTLKIDLSEMLEGDAVADDRGREGETHRGLDRELGWPGPHAATMSPLNSEAARALIGAPAGCVIEWRCESRPLALALASQLAFRWALTAEAKGQREAAVIACWPGPVDQVRSILQARCCGIDLRSVGAQPGASDVNELSRLATMELLDRMMVSLEPREDLRGERCLTELDRQLALSQDLDELRLIVVVGQRPYLALGEALDAGARRLWWEHAQGIATRRGALFFYVHSDDQPCATALQRWALLREGQRDASKDPLGLRLTLEHDDLLGDQLGIDLGWWPRIALLDSRRRSSW